MKIFSHAPATHLCVLSVPVPEPFPSHLLPRLKGVLVCIACFLILLIGIVIAPLRLPISPTHTNGTLRSDQQNQAAAPAATQPIILNRSPSMMLINRADTHANPHSPAKRVRRRLPVKPMTLAKVLDTIDSSISLSVLELKCFLYIQCDLVQVLRFGGPEARDLRP